MEKPPVNPVSKVELPKTEQTLEHFSLSEQEKNIQEVFKLNSRLEESIYDTLGYYNSVENEYEIGQVVVIENREYRITDIKQSREFAKKFNLPIHLNVPIIYLEGESPDRKGGYHKRLKIILMQNNAIFSDSQHDSVLKHEIVHSIENDQTKSEDLEAVYEKAKEVITEDSFDGYFITFNFNKNISEFIADGYVNEPFIQALRNENLYEEFLKSTKYLFEEKITSKQKEEAVKLYSKYLQTIFPNSTYKEIGFKGVPQDFSDENKPSFYTKDIEAAKYYSGLREGTQTVSAIFNFKNPLIINAEKPAPIPIITPDGKTLGTFNDKDINEKIISAGYDGLILNRKFSTPLNGWEILSFNNESRHVLGNDFDIEKFKEFVLKNESKNNKQSIEEFLKEQGLEKVPNIETHFFFNQHSTTEDGKMVADRLDDKDIFIQENAGWDKERLETWQKISSGEFTPEQGIEHEKERGKPFFWPDYFKTIFEKLHGSNKEVLLVDVKSDSEVYQELVSFFGKESPYWNLVDKSKSYEETCERIANVSEFESILQMERENEILENMKTNLFELLKEKPELQNKENLKMLFSMGSFHTRLYHEMKKSGDTVSREFQSSPYTFHPRMAVERVVHFKGSEKAKEYMPKILLLWLLERSNMKYQDISNKVLSRFSDEQTRELFEMYRKSESDDKFRDEAQTWVVEQFKKKN